MMTFKDFVKQISQDDTSFVVRFMEEIMLSQYGDIENFKKALEANPQETMDVVNIFDKDLQEKIEPLLNEELNMESLLVLSKQVKEIADSNTLVDESKIDIDALHDVVSKARDSFTGDNTLEKITFKKKEIREWIGISQKTFNNWLEDWFDDGLKGKKTVSFEEYIEIFKNVLLPKNQNEFDMDKVDEHIEAIKNGIVFSKERLAEIADSDYKVVREMLKNQPEYMGRNKFYYAIAMKFKDILNGEIYK